ncbi:MAG: flippase [Halobacteriovoraceae bacterium]|nr:flippase [Halobacteriovoraceae bacterium]
MQTTKRKLLSNSTWQVLFSILRAVIGFGSTIIIAKKLGPVEFGQIQYAFAIHYLLQLSELFSHPSIVKKLLIEKEFPHDAIMGSSFIISLMTTAAVLCTTLLISSALYENQFLLYVFLAAQIGVIARPFNNISFYYDSILQSKKSSFSQFFGSFLSNITRVIALALTSNLIIQSLLFSAQFFITSISNIIIYFKDTNSIFNWYLNKTIIIEILKKSTPLFFTALTSIIFMKIDIVMLEHLASTSSVGIYSVAVKLSEPWFFFSGAIITSFFPSVILAKKKSIKGYYYKLTRLNSLLFAMGIFISVVMSLTAYYWIHYLFGAEYHQAIQILQIHIWGLTFLFWSSLQHLWEVKENFLKFALIKAISTSTLNVLLNFYLIPKYSGLGAAYATVISYFVVGILFNITSKKSRKYLKIQLKSILVYKYLSLKEFRELF